MSVGHVGVTVIAEWMWSCWYESGRWVSVWQVGKRVIV